MVFRQPDWDCRGIGGGSLRSDVPRHIGIIFSRHVRAQHDARSVHDHWAGNRVRDDVRHAGYWSLPRTRCACLADHPVKNRIRVLRAEMAWSQAELAERIGVARQSINAIETGKADPSLPLGMRIAKVFGKTVEDVFEGD